MKTSSARSCICFFLALFMAFGVGAAAHGADAITFNPVPVFLKASSGGGVPVGTVVAWPAATNPSDAESWLECNGQSTNGYPELAAVVGANVPNYQGIFLRGRGGNSAALGFIQQDAIRNITGTWTFASGHGMGAVQADVSGAFVHASIGGSGLVAMSSGQYYSNRSIVAFDASASVPTANENRPVNVAVRYLIRARP